MYHEYDDFFDGLILLLLLIFACSGMFLMVRTIDDIEYVVCELDDNEQVIREFNVEGIPWIDDGYFKYKIDNKIYVTQGNFKYEKVEKKKDKIK